MLSLQTGLLMSARAVITDNDTHDGDFDDTLTAILGASCMVTPSLDLDLAFGTINSSVDLIALTFSLHSAPSPRFCWLGVYLRSWFWSFTLKPRSRRAPLALRQSAYVFFF